MANTSDDHSQEFEELAALSALDALEGDELARFVDHRARCVRCQRIEQRDREILARLPFASPEIEPSADFKARLLRRAARELESSAPPRRRIVPTAFVLIVAALLLLAGGISIYEQQPAATYELEGSGPGSATLILRRSGTAELDLRDLPEPGPGFEYEVWITQPRGNPQLAGTSSSGSGLISLAGDVRGATVAITREQGQSEVPTPPIVKMIRVAA